MIRRGRAGRLLSALPAPAPFAMSSRCLFPWLLLLPAAVCCAAPADAPASGLDEPPARGWLRRAFDFSSVILNDAYDRSHSQHVTVLEALACGDPEMARVLALNSSGWWQGLSLVEVARRFEGDDQADLLRRAEAVRATSEDWQRGRISVAIAALHHASARPTEALAVEARLSDEADLRTVAAARLRAAAERGDWATLEREVAHLTEALTVENAPAWFEALFAAIEQSSGASRENVLTEALRAAADRLPVWAVVRALGAVPAGDRGLLFEELRVCAVRQVAEASSSSPPHILIPSALALARLARETGDLPAAAALLDQCAASATRLQPFEAPGYLADLAAERWLAGQQALAADAFADALTRIEPIDNPRPRALAAAAFCRALARIGYPNPSIFADKLDRLHAGLVAQYLDRGLLAGTETVAPATPAP